MLGRRLSFVTTGAAGAAALTAASAPAPLYPEYQRLWGLSAFTLTVVFAVYVFALLAALLTLGSLSDRVGRRPMACGALLLLAVGTLLFPIADGAGDLVVARIVQGFAVGAATATTTAMITDAAPNPRVGSIVSSAVPPVGIVTGAVLAGALVQFAPLPRQLVFYVLGAFYLLLAAAVWLVPDGGRSGDEARTPLWRSLVPSVGLPPTVRPVFLGLVPSIAATWALGGLYLSLGSSVLRAVFDVRGQFIVGVVLAAFFGAGVAGTVIATLLPPRHRERFGYGSLAAGVLVTVVATAAAGLPAYVIGSVIAGVGFGASFRFALGALSDASPADRRGEVFATMYIVSYVAFGVPALAAGLAADSFGLRPTAIVYGTGELALVVTATAVELVRARRHHERRTHETVTA